MEIKFNKINDVTVLALVGRMDSQTSLHVEDKVREALIGGSTKIVLDCADLAYTSSAGLRVILNAAKAARSKDGDLVLANVQLPVEKVLSLTGFTSMITLYPDVQAALGHFS
jgi:anti-sigma B factor antagonist